VSRAESSPRHPDDDAGAPGEAIGFESAPSALWVAGRLDLAHGRWGGSGRSSLDERRMARAPARARKLAIRDHEHRRLRQREARACRDRLRRAA
jgi:hypothetical protein